MKLFELRKELKSKFIENNIDAVDADFIAAEVLGVGRTELILIDEINEEQVAEINEKAEMRLNNVPVEKIFKRSYFYGLEFKVDDNVLSPRPESEMLVENAIKYNRDGGFVKVSLNCKLSFRQFHQGNYNALGTDFCFSFYDIFDLGPLRIRQHRGIDHHIHLVFCNTHHRIHKAFGL